MVYAEPDGSHCSRMPCASENQCVEDGTSPQDLSCNASRTSMALRNAMRNSDWMVGSTQRGIASFEEQRCELQKIQ
jgi:hypothetical protein